MLFFSFEGAGCNGLPLVFICYGKINLRLVTDDALK